MVPYSSKSPFFNVRRVNLGTGSEVFVRRASNRDTARVANENNLFFYSTHLSKLHACLKGEGEDIFIKDCNSTFGTVLNGEFLVSDSWFKLGDGDLIGFIVSKPSSYIDLIVKDSGQQKLPLSSFGNPDVVLKFRIRLEGDYLTFIPVNKFPVDTEYDPSNLASGGFTADMDALNNECFKDEDDNFQDYDQKSTVDEKLKGMVLKFACSENNQGKQESELPASGLVCCTVKPPILADPDDSISDNSKVHETSSEVDIKTERACMDSSDSSECANCTFGDGDITSSESSGASTFEEGYTSDESINEVGCRIMVESDDFYSDSSDSEFELSMPFEDEESDDNPWNDNVQGSMDEIFRKRRLFNDSNEKDVSYVEEKDDSGVLVSSPSSRLEDSEVEVEQSANLQCCDVEYRSVNNSTCVPNLITLQDSDDEHVQIPSRKRKYSQLSDNEGDSTESDLEGGNEKRQRVDPYKIRSIGKEIFKGTLYALATVTALGIYGSTIVPE